MAAQGNASRPPTPTFEVASHLVGSPDDLKVTVQGPKHNDRRPITTFRVKRNAVTSFSEYFANSLRFNTQFGHNIVLKDDNADAVRVWLFYMHAAEKHAASDDGMEATSEPETADNSQQTLFGSQSQQDLFNSPGVADTDITRIWHIINVGDKYMFDVELLQGFFQIWYKKHVDLSDKDIKAAFVTQLAFPCYMFDHAQAFSAVTRWLAYNFAGHITEGRPVGFKDKHLHLSPRDFVGPMNHARGSLKTVLHRGLWGKVGDILEDGKDSCTCGQWASVCGRYFAELVELDAYPLETVFPKNSINTILSRLSQFELGRVGTCRLCSFDWDTSVERAVEYTEDCFQGLCIDCMANSRPGKDKDKEYWKTLGSDFVGRFDHNCRITHGQKTWYISWCGRDEHRRKLLDEHSLKHRSAKNRPHV